MKNPFNDLKKTITDLHRAHGKPERESVDNFNIGFDYDRFGILAPLVNAALRPILNLIDEHGTSYIHFNQKWNNYAYAARREIYAWTQALEPSDLPPIRLLSVEMWDGGPDQGRICDWLEAHRAKVIEEAVMADCHANLDYLIGEACTALGWHSVPDSAHMEFNFDWIN